MRHFIFETEKEYTPRIYFRRQREGRDSAKELMQLLKKNRTGGRALISRKPKTANFSFVPKSPRIDLRQKCIAKMQYSGSVEAHHVQLEKYLTREGTDIDGGQAKLFGTDTTEYKQNMDAKNFRIFLSPQNSGIDLQDLTENFVKRLELQTGYKLHWQGACHYNTAHPHAHILINGVDKFGRDVQFPRDVVKTFMRESARALCTERAGLRTMRDVEIEREAELSAPRFTRIDKKIFERYGNRMNAEEVRHVPGVDVRRIRVRMDALCKLKLCTYKDGGYKLKDGWGEDLKANGRYNAYLKARDELRYTPAHSLRVYSGETKYLTGKVTKVYRLDGDASDNHAAVVESIDGKAFFVPFFKQPEAWEKGIKTQLKEGDYITLKPRQSQKGRLTPTIFKTDAQTLRRLVKSNKYRGALAAEISAGKELRTVPPGGRSR